MSIEKRQAKGLDGYPIGRGRPSGVVYKPFMKHDFEKIKEENRLAYAEATIRNAKHLYERYDASYPNPLNIDDKDLVYEAKQTWEYIFHTREFNIDKVVTENAGTRDRIFYNADEVIFAFECYVDYIKNKNYVKNIFRPDGTVGVLPLIPNQSNLSRWLGIRRNIVYDSISKDERAQKQYMAILADCLSEGAMAGVYQAGSTQFALKNMCDWADKYEDKSYKRDTQLAVDEANDLMKQLGYSREKATLEAPKPLLEEGADIDG